MPAQSWQCATTTYRRWRTITALWPSRSCRFPSATSLQTWILKPSNRSDRWDVNRKHAWMYLGRARWTYSIIQMTKLSWKYRGMVHSCFSLTFSGNNHPHPGHRHGKTRGDTRLLQAKSGQLWLHQWRACDMCMYTLRSHHFPFLPVQLSLPLWPLELSHEG